MGVGRNKQRTEWLAEKLKRSLKSQLEQRKKLMNTRIPIVMLNWWKHTMNIGRLNERMHMQLNTMMRNRYRY